MRGAPGLYLTKDYALYMFTDSAVHPPKFDFGPGELCGFHTGTMLENRLSDLRSGALTSSARRFCAGVQTN